MSFLKGLVDNKLALVKVMAGLWTGDKPLSEPMMTKFYDAILHHWSTVGLTLNPLGA